MTQLDTEGHPSEWVGTQGAFSLRLKRNHFMTFHEKKRLERTAPQHPVNNFRRRKRPYETFSGTGCSIGLGPLDDFLIYVIEIRRNKVNIQGLRSAQWKHRVGWGNLSIFFALTARENFKLMTRGGSRIFIGEGLQVQEAPPGPGGAPWPTAYPIDTYLGRYTINHNRFS